MGMTSLCVIVQQNCSETMCVSSYLNLKFECDIKLSPVPVFTMSLGKAEGHSKLPDDDFIPDTKHPRLSASNPKKVKQHFAGYYFK